MSDINATLAARLLLNQAQPNQNLTRETLEILPEFGIELCQSQWRQRTAFRQSAVWGQTVHDLDNKAAVTEVEELSSELLQLLELM
jgi:chromosome partitioning protein